MQQLVDAPFWQLFSPVEDSLDAARDRIRQPAQGHTRKMLLVQQAQGGRQLLLRFMCEPHCVQHARVIPRNAVRAAQLPHQP